MALNIQQFQNADIIESGSNANGSWTKFGNGLMICQHEYTIAPITATFGALYRSSSATNWTFPQSFVGNVPFVSSNDKNSSQIWTAHNATLSSSDAYGFFSSSLSGSRTISAIAIGRWK